MTEEMPSYNLANIRKLLGLAFTAERLRRFCQDRLDFRPVVSDFGTDQNLNGMVDKLIDYCLSFDLVEQLLSEVKGENPKIYEKYRDRLRLPNLTDGVLRSQPLVTSNDWRFLRVIGQPRNVIKVLRAVRDKNIRFLKEYLLSLELANYVGEYVKYGTEAEGLIEFDTIKELLDTAVTESHTCFRCNVIELAGSLGILWRENSLVREEIAPTIERIIENISREQFYPWELAHVKLALLQRDEQPIDMVIDAVKKEGRSFYALGTMETPLLYLHHALRDPDRFYPIRPYTALLLSLLIGDSEVLRLEKESALQFERRQAVPEERLIQELKDIIA